METLCAPTHYGGTEKNSCVTHMDGDVDEMEQWQRCEWPTFLHAIPVLNGNLS
jgi:hypothetical protein